MSNSLTKRAAELSYNKFEGLKQNQEIRAKLPDYRRAELNPFTDTNSWEEIHDTFVEETEIDDSINFYYWLKDNYNVPTKK